MRIKKLFNVWKKNSSLIISESMAYKLGFLLQCISLFIGDLIIPFVSVVIYSVSNGIPGWSLNQFILFQGTLILVIGLWHAFFASILGWTIDNIEEGTFDKILLRPFNSLAYLTTVSFDLEGLAEVVAGICIVGFALIKLNLFSWLLLPYALIIILALLFELSLTVIASAFAFLFIKTWRLFELINVVERFARYPADIYSFSIRFIITFLVPAAIASYYPVGVLLGRIPLTTVIWVALPVFVFFGVSLVLWHFAIRKYTSAGG